MKIVVGILCLSFLILYMGQVITVVNLGWAQRLGLQENPATADPILSGLEVWTARWDLLWFWTLPIAGALVLIDHPWWPYAALIGGGAFVDAGGREAAKHLGLREQRVRTGSPGYQRLVMSVFAAMITVGSLAIVTALIELT